jgi:hypothetical protein
MSDRLDIVRLILSGPSQGYRILPRINERSHGGRGDCILHGAVIQGSLEMTQLLLEHGADPTILSHDQLTVHQLAIQYKQFTVAAFLETHLKTVRPPPKSRKDPKHQAAASATPTHTPTPTPTQSTPATAAPTSAASTATKAKAETSKYQRETRTRKNSSKGKKKGEKRKRKQRAPTRGSSTPDASSAASADTTASRVHEEL